MTDRADKTTAMNPTGSLDELDNKRTTTTATLQATDPDPNGNGSARSRGQLIHSVSIIVEPVLDDIEPLQDSKDKDESCLPSNDDKRIMTSDTTFEPGQRLLRKERIHSSPIIVMDDHFLGKKRGREKEKQNEIMTDPPPIYLFKNL